MTQFTDYSYLFRIWLLATLLLSFEGLNGMVICFEADGHVSIEIGAEEGCQDGIPETSDPSNHSHTITVSRAGSSHCGPCVDRPLLPGRFLSRQLSNDDYPQENHAVAVHSSVNPLEYSSPTLSSQLILRRNTTSTLPRTVVLLI